MKTPKDVLAVASVLAMALVAFFLTRPAASPLPEPHEHEPPALREVSYRVEGGSSGLRFAEVEIDGPGEAHVRYQLHGGPVVEETLAWSAEEHEALMRALAAVDFFEVEEVPRHGFDPSMPRTTLAASLGDRWNQVRIDGRTRPSRSLDGALAALDAVRLAVTPEALLTGD